MRMYTLFLLFFSITATSLLAQPSQQRVLQDIQKSWPGAYGIRFDGSPMETNDGAYYTWSQLAICTTKTDLASKYPSAQLVVFGAAVYYKLTNGSFQFKEYSAPEGHYGYIGVPGPAEKDILEWLDRNGGKPALFGGDASRITKIHSFRIIPKFFKDKDLLNYAFDVDTEYDYVSYAGTAVTYRTRFNVEMRKLDNGQWFDNVSSDKAWGYPVALKERTITKDEETKLLQSNIVAAAGSSAVAAEVAKLPKIDVPAFTSGFQMISYTHNLLRTGKPDMLKAYLYKTLHPDYFVGNSLLLTEEGNQFVKSLIEVTYSPLITYADMYCDDPGADGVLDKEDATTLSYFSKSAKYKAEISLRKVQTTWKIWYIKFSLPAKSESEKIRTSVCATDAKMTVKMMAGEKSKPAGNTTSVWQDFTSAQGNFKIQFPGKVEEKIMPSGNLTYYNYYASSTDGALYTAVAVKAGRTYTDTEAASVAQNFLKSFASAATIVDQKAVSRGQSGIESVLDKQGKYDVRYTAFVQGEYIYQLYVMSNKGARIETNENQFFDSFETSGSPNKSEAKKDGGKDKKKKKK